MYTQDNTRMTKNEKKQVERQQHYVYPFVDELVNTLFTGEINDLMSKHIEGAYDKQVFLMFIMLYFGVHIHLDGEATEDKKQAIKYIVTECVKDPIKRQSCLEMFARVVPELKENAKRLTE